MAALGRLPFHIRPPRRRQPQTLSIAGMSL